MKNLREKNQKVGILIPKPFLKFLKLKNQTKQKDPLKYQKTQKCFKEKENRKIEENRPPKSGYSESNTIFEIFKTQKPNPKQTF